MSEVLILIGVIMVVSGIAIYYIGLRRNVPNTILWAFFPILHGLHEFADYFLEFYDIFIIEQFEMFFAIAGAFLLLGATLEYNGALAKPIGKITAFFGMISIGPGTDEIIIKDI